MSPSITKALSAFERNGYVESNTVIVKIRKMFMSKPITEIIDLINQTLKLAKQEKADRLNYILEIAKIEAEDRAKETRVKPG